MTITQLMYFVAVAEELNITRIADRFHVSQPAVSSAIRDLEKEFHITLFERHHNELFLTVPGNTAYQRAKRLVEHYEAFQTGMEKLQMEKTISLAIAPNIAAIHLSKLFLYMRDQLPDVTINMEESIIVNMTQMLKNNLLDAACFSCRDGMRDPALTYVPVGAFSLSLCASPSLLKTESNIVPPAKLEGIPMVLQFKSSQLNTFVMEYFSKFHITPNVIFYANQLTTISEFVRDGIAVGFLPPELIERDPDIMQYHLPGADSLEGMPIYFVYKKKTPIVENLLKIFRSYFEMTRIEREKMKETRKIEK